MRRAFEKETQVGHNLKSLIFLEEKTFTYHDVEKEAGGENGEKVILVEGDVGRGSEDGKVRLEANAWKI